MNFGPCPYVECNGELSLAVPEKTPAFVKVQCPTCKRSLWYKLSRVSPEAWTEDEFARDFEIDQQAKMVTRKRAQGEERP